jgi:hypothetical protein
VLDALKLTNEPRAGDRAILGRLSAPRWIPAVEVLGKGMKTVDCLRLKPAIGQFLDTVGEPVFEEAAVVRRRFGLE